MKINTTTLSKIEFACLCGLAFSLPIIEITKHIFSIGLFLSFTGRYFLHRQTIKTSPLTKYILIFLALSTITSIGAYFKGYEVLKLHDIFRYSIIGLIIIHIPLTKNQLYILIWLLAIGTFIGITEAYWLLYNKEMTSFQLRSVGHINHSSIYILLIIGATLPLILKRKKLFTLLFILLINIALIYVLIATNSRATTLTLAIMMGALLIVLFYSYKRMGYLLCLLLALSSVYLTFNPPNILNKFLVYHNLYKNDMAPREKLWNTAYHAWKKEPLFGIGYGNYPIITPTLMQKWYKDTNIDVTDQRFFLYLSHTHNRYVNTLVEGGIIGTVGLVILLGGTAYFLLFSFKASLRNRHIIFFWLIGFNSLIVITITGLFNTTLHHEHGMLAMILIGISANFITNKGLTNEA